MPGGGSLAFETSNVRVGAGTHADLEPGDYVLIAVTDTGTGMPPEVLARATEPFFTTKGVGRGTGLGLSTAYGFLRQSGGTLRITSHPGAGTTVKIYLPRAEAPPAPVQREAGVVAAVPKGELVLVVDDDEGMRTAAGEMLGELGYAVVLAPNGPRALEILAANRGIRTMVADYAMPGMTGAELLERARAVRPDLRALLITGYAKGLDFERVQPAAAVLRKPFSLAELAEGLHAAR
jgi:CheY-like chemotaxis protein